MLQTIWDFLGSPQFQHLASLASTVAIFILIPLYKRLSAMVEALKRIPIIEAVQREHSARIGTLEAHQVAKVRR